MDVDIFFSSKKSSIVITTKFSVLSLILACSDKYFSFCKLLQLSNLILIIYSFISLFLSSFFLELSIFSKFELLLSSSK